MRAGRLDRLITIEKKEVTVDPVYGSELVTWVALSYLPGSPPVAERFAAEIQDALPSRSEAVQQGLAIGRNQTRCRIRWRGDVDSSRRVTLHGDTDQVYQIVGGPAEIDGRKGGLEMVLEKYSS